VLYASLWATRRPPWSVYAPSYMPGSGLYKSTDGGDTWKQLAGGLPNDAFLGRIGIAVSPSNPNRLWAVVDHIGRAVARPRNGPADASVTETPKGGVYLSDDAGATWRLVNSENRLWGRGWYFAGVAVDPVNPDRSYVINTATYMTTDAGKMFVPIKGAPGGDDYHQMWVNPNDGNRMVVSSDHGTVISVDGGKPGARGTISPPHSSITWRPTIVPIGSTPRSRIAAESASVRGRAKARSRSATGNHLFGRGKRTVLPDPKDGNILYGNGNGRCDQALNIAIPTRGELPPADPNDPNRKTWRLPQMFSQADEALYYANQFVMRSRDRGRTWEKISPDLARLNPAVPATLDPITAKDIDEVLTQSFRSGLFHRALAASGNHGLGWNRRRVDLCHTRRWQNMEQCHASGDDRTEQGITN
jgi:hypothetical protein